MVETEEEMGEPDPYWDYDDEEECWNCGGDGFVASCFEEYACMYPDEGCDLCKRPCDVCRPQKPNPELQQVLANALRDRDGAVGRDANAAPVPQDRQARAEGIAQGPQS